MANEINQNQMKADIVKDISRLLKENTSRTTRMDTKSLEKEMQAQTKTLQQLHDDLKRMERVFQEMNRQNEKLTNVIATFSEVVKHNATVTP